MTEVKHEELFAIIRTAAKIPATVLINESSRFEQDLGVDSLDLVGVLLNVQDEFGIEWTDEEIASIKSVSDIITHLDRHGLKLSAA
jgi:acyl carrier protein